MINNYLQPRYASALLNNWPIFLGMTVMFSMTYYRLLNDVWSKDTQGYGPIVFGLILYLFWQKREDFFIKSEPSKLIGYSAFIVGLILYFLGHSQEIIHFEVASQTIIIAAIILIFSGYKLLKKVWFPLFFMMFLVPFPGVIIDAITMPMKLAVSTVAESILYWMNYPVARNGVIIQIGQYQLLVADACAGMHTLISLEALGLLYLNLVKHESFWRNISLAILIVPISFTANTIRVIAITLITYYFGNDVGQGFIHGAAGMFLFLIALILIIAIDSAIQIYLVKKRPL